MKLSSTSAICGIEIPATFQAAKRFEAFVDPGFRSLACGDHRSTLGLTPTALQAAGCRRAVSALAVQKRMRMRATVGRESQKGSLLSTPLGPAGLILRSQLTRARRNASYTAVTRPSSADIRITRDPFNS
jgi:hypothetical protein